MTSNWKEKSFPIMKGRKTMKMKKVVAMVSALAMAAGLCTSAAADEAATDSDLSEHVEITIGGINMGSSDTKEGWPNEVVQKLED